jgi:hypothetical protein
MCGRKRRLLQGAIFIALLGSMGGCSFMDEPPEIGQCLPYPELKRRCDEAFTNCLDSPIQSIPGDKRGHSQCYPCRDLCMRGNGVWPDLALNKPCR